MPLSLILLRKAKSGSPGSHTPSYLHIRVGRGQAPAMAGWALVNLLGRNRKNPFRTSSNTEETRAPGRLGKVKATSAGGSFWTIGDNTKSISIWLRKMYPCTHCKAKISGVLRSHAVGTFRSENLVEEKLGSWEAPHPLIQQRCPFGGWHAGDTPSLRLKHLRVLLNLSHGPWISQLFSEPLFLHLWSQGVG